MRYLRYTIIFCLLFASVSSLPTAVADYPENTRGHVNDLANLLKPTTYRQLDRELKTLKQKTGVHIEVLTILRRSDHNSSRSIEKFATQLFNKWGIGDAVRNDGVLILVAKQDREMRIELGRGYGRHYDKSMQRIIDRKMLPQFKQGNYSKGIADGTKAVVAGILDRDLSNKSEPITFFGSIDIVAWFSDIYHSTVGKVALFLLGLVGVGSGVGLTRHRKRNKPRTCPACQIQMSRLTEDKEDIFLSTSQRTEEQVKSIDYDVWQCGQCQQVSIESYRKWFSRYGACGQCNAKTLGSTTTVVKRATEYSTGKERIDDKCEHCGYKNTRYAVIPIIVSSDDDDDSSSFSSGGFSSGSSSGSGGSSSGGGASGSW